MTLRQYLISMSLATLIAWLAFALVLFLVDPASAEIAGLIIFYVSLFLAILGTISVLGFFLRVKLHKGEVILPREVAGAFRQGFFLSFLFVSALYLQSKDMLVWWNIVLLVGAVTILEFLFISYRRSR